MIIHIHIYIYIYTHLYLKKGYEKRQLNEVFDCSVIEDNVFPSSTSLPDSYRLITKVTAATSCVVGQFLWVDLCIKLIPIDKYLVVQTCSVVFVAIETYLIFCCSNAYKRFASWLHHKPWSSHCNYIGPRIALISIARIIFGFYNY